MSITTKRVGSAVDVNRFQIRTKKGLKQFLKVVHPGFLAYVDPRRSSLLDIMIQNDLLTDSDQESLSGKGVYVRRDQARKLWFSLQKMRVRDFTCTVLPELCSNFPHILPEEWMDSNEDGPDEEYCFRHDIMDKVRPATMADLLFDCDCLSLEDYTELSERNVNQEMIWKALFEAVRRTNTGDTEQALRGLLNTRKVDVPNNFLDLLSSGIPCTCHRSEQRLLTSITPATSEEKITKWFMMSHSKGGSTVDSDVCTTVDGLSIAERDTDSLFGSGEGSFFSQKPTRAKSPFPDDVIRIVLIGKPGAGKSTTGNTILGEKVFDNRSWLSALTRNCEKMTAKRNGTKIEILDTPGLCHPLMTQQEIFVTIVQAVVGMHPGPHAILYVIKLGRYTAEEHDAYTRLKALFNEKITKYTIVLFTYGDMLKYDGSSVEDTPFQGAPKELQGMLKECSNRYIVFNNMARDTHAQVERLLSMVKHMVTQNGGQAYSCPKYGQIGQGMEEEGSQEKADRGATPPKQRGATEEGRAERKTVAGEESRRKGSGQETRGAPRKGDREAEREDRRPYSRPFSLQGDLQLLKRLNTKQHERNLH